MSLSYIRKSYKVPAKCGNRVYASFKGVRTEGKIVAAKGGYLKIRFLKPDGSYTSISYPFHPTDHGVEYILEEEENNELEVGAVKNNSEGPQEGSVSEISSVEQPTEISNPNS